MIASRPVLAVTGLMAEARIAAGRGVTTLAGGGDAARLALLLQAALAKGARAVISFGIAGGLKPGLQAGTVLIGRSVDDGRTRTAADSGWIAHLVEALPHALVADLVGVDQAVCGVDGKADLYGRTGALAVDMESHIAARLAAQHGVPFAALRIIADPAERTVPHAATVGMRPDGSTDVGAVIKALRRRPGELPGLLRTAFDARAAFAALKRSRASLSSLFGFHDPQPEAGREDWFDLPAGVELDGFSALSRPGLKLPAETA